MEWNEIMAGHQFMREDFAHDDEPSKKAYKRGFEDGCREGWRKAMEEAQLSFHERKSPMGHHYGQRDGYGERNITGNDYSFDPHRDGFGHRDHNEKETMIREIVERVTTALGERRSR